MKRHFPDAPLGEPIKSFDDTFSAETVMLDAFFKSRPECPNCKGQGRVGVMACNDCGATGVVLPSTNRTGAA